MDYLLLQPQDLRDSALVDLAPSGGRIPRSSHDTLVKFGLWPQVASQRRWLTVPLVAILKNSRHEKFSQGVASGLSGSEAYRQVAGAAAGNADVIADDLMNRPGVRERIAELKEANSRRATLSREQTIEFLCNVINTSAAKVDADSSLVQSAEFENGQPVKLRIPDKIAAVKELTKMCGWTHRIVSNCRPGTRWRNSSTQSARRRAGPACRLTRKTTGCAPPFRGAFTAGNASNASG
jgi:hypothetical protein